MISFIIANRHRKRINESFKAKKGSGRSLHAWPSSYVNSFNDFA